VVAKLEGSGGEPLGEMRFTLSELDDGTRTLVSNFRKIGASAWGSDRTAIKAAGSPLASGSTPSGDSAGGGARAPMHTGYVDRLIDPDVWQCSVCTLINDAAASRCSVCETQKPLHLGWVQAASHDDVAASDASLRAGFAAAASGGVASHGERLEERGPVEVIQEPPQQPEPPQVQVQPQQQWPPSSKLLPWLAHHGLEEYHAALDEAGFELLGDMQEAEQRELDEIFTSAGVRPGHMLRFRRALRESKAISSS